MLIKVIYWRQRDPSRQSFLSSIKDLVSGVSATVVSEFFSGLLRQGITQADSRALCAVLLDENDTDAFEGALYLGHCSHCPGELISLCFDSFYCADADRC
jgi:hypothetical protein